MRTIAAASEDISEQTIALADEPYAANDTAALKWAAVHAGEFGADGATGCAVEYAGPAVRAPAPPQGRAA